GGGWLDAIGNAIWSVLPIPKKEEAPKLELDPMAVVLRFALLYYYPVGTRMRPRGKYVVMKENNATTSLDSNCWHYWESHTQIGEFGEPLRQAAKFLDPQKSAPLKFLINRSIQGMDKLRTFYLELMETKEDRSYLNTCEILYNYVKLLEEVMESGPRMDQKSTTLQRPGWGDDDIECFFKHFRDLEMKDSQSGEYRLLLTALDQLLTYYEAGSRDSLTQQLPRIIEDIRNQAPDRDPRSSPDFESFDSAAEEDPWAAIDRQRRHENSAYYGYVQHQLLEQNESRGSIHNGKPHF
ncbi:MAG: hypothetical protein KDK78_05320, partial [Chlamydiia bacterium]|nr:hypothetical protein [Chlamydiia bacterium]